MQYCKFSLGALLFILLQSQNLFAETVQVFCLSDKSIDTLKTEIQTARGWRELQFHIEGEFEIEEKPKNLAVPFKAQILLNRSAMGGNTLKGDFQFQNPYLNQAEDLSQASSIYTEITVLKNRLRKTNDNFGLKKGDLYGFGIHCSSQSWGE